MLKKFPEGFKEFTTAKQSDKDKVQPDPYVSAAIMYDQLKMADKAQQAFDRALTNNKTDPATITSYATWLIRSGSQDALAKAEALLTEGRKANPGNLNLLLLSGVDARMLKKSKAAEDFLVEAHGIAPGNSEIINQLAQVLTEQADQAKRERALQFANMSAQMNSQNPDAMMTYAWVLLMNGRTGDAAQALKNALQLGSLSPDGKYLVSKMIAEQKPDAAKQILKEALDSDSPGIFVYRKDAQGLLDSLSSGSSGGATPPANK
jgi:cytochrome c-type biogenesis protein CcmH/NrfG